MPSFRIGYGCDLHRLVPERKLMLCGLEIPHPCGLLGHSDADAPIHALIDALLGALGLGDIGRQFPDSDPAFKNASGEFLLSECLKMSEFEEWRIENADITILAQAPRLAPYLDSMRTNLARMLGITPDRVSVKAKTAEGLGSVGRGEAMEARAVVLLQGQGDS